MASIFGRVNYIIKVFQYLNLYYLPSCTITQELVVCELPNLVTLILTLNYFSIIFNSLIAFLQICLMVGVEIYCTQQLNSWQNLHLATQCLEDWYLTFMLRMYYKLNYKRFTFLRCTFSFFMKMVSTPFQQIGGCYQGEVLQMILRFQGLLKSIYLKFQYYLRQTSFYWKPTSTLQQTLTLSLMRQIGTLTVFIFRPILRSKQRDSYQVIQLGTVSYSQGCFSQIYSLIGLANLTCDLKFHTLRYTRSIAHTYSVGHFSCSFYSNFIEL